QRLMEAIDNAANLPVSLHSNFSVPEWKQKCYDAMNDDFNSPILIAHLFDAVKAINLIHYGKDRTTQNDKEVLTAPLNAFVCDVLGFIKEDARMDSNDKLENVVNILINMRNEARANKDFALSDLIRNQLTAIGIELKDGKEGTTFTL